MLALMKSILEIIYFLSAPALLIVSIIGLQQLKIAKANSKVNSTREAYKLSAEQCSHYLLNIVPELNMISTLTKDKIINSFEPVEIILINKQYELRSNLSQQDKENIKMLLPDVLPVLNMLESFSIFFTTKIAEESIAFNTIGFSFCFHIKYLLPIICLVGNRYYSSILSLYIVWNDKIEKQKALENMIQSKQVLETACTIDLKSIGT